MEDTGQSHLLWKAMAGLEAGIAGSLIMIAWDMLGCWVQGESLWTIPNLLAATFFGGRMYRPDLVLRTFCGLALHFSLGGLLGALYGLIRPRSLGGLSTAFLGMVSSLALYSLAAHWLWPRLNPMMAIVYSSQSFVIIGYVLYGVAQGLIPGFLQTFMQTEAAEPG